MAHTLDRTANTMLDEACGMTVDLFRPMGEPRASVQWVWAMPLARLDLLGLDEPGVLDRLLTLVRRAGFEPDDHRSAHRSLPNGFSHEPSCPFAASECTGEHLVVSGAGVLAEHRIGNAAEVLGQTLAHMLFRPPSPRTSR